MTALPAPADVIAHRPPFLFVDEVTALEPGQSARGVWRLTGEEWFFAGHFPGRPTLPGVLMCEAAAQLSAYFAKTTGLAENGTVGLGGLDKVRFRGPVVPGDRLVLMLKKGRVRKNVMFSADFQGFVKENLVVDGVIKGVVLN